MFQFTVSLALVMGTLIKKVITVRALKPGSANIQCVSELRQHWLGWGNGVMPDGTKPLPKPMLTCQVFCGIPLGAI